jgi:hypothetical protein
MEPAAQRHLDSCHDCRQFAADVQTIWKLSESPVSTPALLRERTLDQCREMLAERAAVRAMSPWQRCRRLIDSPRFVAAVATLGVLIVISVTILQINNNGDSDANWLMKLAVTQFAVQNYVAALFLPVFLVLKNRFGARQSRTLELGD